MSFQKQKQPEQPSQQVKLTVRIENTTYAAIIDLQREQLLRIGRRKPLREIVESAILAYVSQRGRKTKSDEHD
jgi:hypothetical protein